LNLKGYEVGVTTEMSILNACGERVDNIINQTTKIMNDSGEKFENEFLDNLSKDLKHSSKN